MCGIAGWLGYPGDTSETVPRVLRALRHRGPDACDSKSFAHATLVHTRLKVIDLSEAGAQPMPNEDETVWTVFNGEIYNHRQLRHDLERRGHRFRGHADTEVIPHLYEEYGAAFPERLRGMFAVAVLDLRRSRLVLARDRFGIKPLHYATHQSAVVFASELAALRAVPGLDFTPDPQAIHDFIALHVVPVPQTLYRGIRTLEPGEQLVADLRTGRVGTRLTRYHTWTVSPDASLARDDAATHAEQLVLQAVSRQLESDVPLGSLLSGGIDSSIVSAAAQRGVGGALRTFGVAFEEPAFDEGPAIARAAAALSTEHEMLAFTSTSPTWDDIVSLLRAPGQPFADTSLFAVDRLCRAVRARVTVALSGDGGDEGFGGYTYYGRLPTLARAQFLPNPARRAAVLATAALTRPLAAVGMVPTQVPTRLVDMADAADPVDAVADIVAWTRSREMERLWIGPSVESVRRLFEPRWEHAASASALDRLAALLTEADTRVRLASDYLPKVDIASMRSSLEVRVPLLDEDLFQFGLTLPFRLKHARGETKPVLRDVARRWVPSMADLPKHGFGIPVDTWIDDAIRSQLRTEILGPASRLGEFVDLAACQRLITHFERRQPPRDLTRQGLYQRVFMLLALQVHLS